LSTGDGIYFAKKLGATIQDLSLIQFHPTGLVQEGNIAFLISEALRGAGAVLRNKSGQTFMANYDERADLAPRDIVSRAILEEMNKTGADHVYLDATKVDSYFLKAHFPNIRKQCLDICGIDIQKNLIPIIPVQHYSCGGILVNEFGESTISNLFAIGEVACTGLHGANRLASNSLLEAIAFAKFSIKKLLQISKCEINTQPLALKSSFKNIDIILIQQTMSKYAGVIKTNQQLFKAREILLKIKTDAIVENMPKHEYLQNEIMLELAIDLLNDAISQKENKGVHFNLDLV
jgi:L-aspartate oxidase